MLVYTISLNLTKLSILQQYLRFLTGKPIRRTCWALTGIIVVYTITNTFLCIFTCTPVNFFWNQVVDPSGGSCLDERALWFAQASFNIISDVAILILPMRSLYKIHLPQKQKLALMVVFALGILYAYPPPRPVTDPLTHLSVSAISIIRLQSLYNVSNSSDVTCM